MSEELRKGGRYHIINEYFSPEPIYVLEDIIIRENGVKDYKFKRLGMELNFSSIGKYKFEEVKEEVKND